MTTGIVRGKIYVTLSDSPGPKIRGADENSAQLSFTGTELYRFESSIVCNVKFSTF